MIPDYKLFNIPRREVMHMQVSLSYRQYLILKLEILEKEYEKYVDKYWKSRTSKEINVMSSYTKAIDTTQKLLDSMRKADKVELEREVNS